jgi:TRAP transporter TAXI family solute receptor
VRALLAVVAALVLVACRSGPDETALRKDVAERISQALPAGTVAMDTLERRGSQSDAKTPAGETRRVIYFDTELRLERDFDFGAWDSPGVAGLVSALGTGPRGIVGIASGGNKAGDRVIAHGTALYRRDGDRWVAVTSGGFVPAVPPEYATGAPPGDPIGMLDSMRTVVSNTPRDPPVAWALIEEELARANATIRAVLARSTQGYAIAAGPEHGEYLRFARALAEAKGARIVPLITRGGDENLRLLREGKVSLALSQADAALAAFEGKGRFAEDGPHATLRALGALYPEPVHVIVRGDSALGSVADLAGRRISVGPVGSASRSTALRVLEAHGFDATSLRQVLDLPLNEALVGLRAGEVDAVIQVIGAPADSVRDALTDVPLRLMPLAERAVAALAASNGGYFAHSIPKGAYATQTQDVQTVATAALLLAGDDLGEAEVGALTRYVYGHVRDFAALGSVQGTRVSAAHARLGLSIPQDVAAAKALDAILQAAGSAPTPAFSGARPAATGK